MMLSCGGSGGCSGGVVGLSIKLSQISLVYSLTELGKNWLFRDSLCKISVHSDEKWIILS